MKPEELKKLIKSYVRQCLTEVLAERFVQSIVQEAVVEGLKGAKVIQEAAPEDSPRPQRRMPTTRTPLTEDVGNKAMKNLGVKDPLMESIFRDTLASSNPIVTGEDASAAEVPESALEQIGVFDKNWDKYIK